MLEVWTIQFTAAAGMFSEPRKDSMIENTIGKESSKLEMKYAWYANSRRDTQKGDKVTTRFVPVLVTTCLYTLGIQNQALGCCFLLHNQDELVVRHRNTLTFFILSSGNASTVATLPFTWPKLCILSLAVAWSPEYCC